jgi:MFS family permease
MEHRNYPPLSLAWLIWILGAAFYFAGFFHRVTPAVMTDQLMAEFHIGAAALGNFTAFYFYSYFLIQIPTGLLADYWGPRRLLTAGALTVAAGTFLFASAATIWPANLGRLLIGGASGFGFVALLTISARWFPARIYATLSGIALSCGVIGAVSAGVPLRLLVDAFGWRPVMFAAAALLLLLGAAIWLIVRDDPSERGYRSHCAPDPQAAPFSWRALGGDLRTLLGYRNARLLSLVGAGLTGPVMAFAGLWGVPFFASQYNLSVATSATITSLLLICYALGGALLAILSDRIGRRRPLMLASAAAALLAWLPILFVPRLSLVLLIALVVVTGLATGSVIVGFAFAKESVPLRFSGTVSGVYNMGSMLGALILQPLIGWLLDLNWRGAMAGGARIYDLEAYRIAFLPLVALAALSVFLLFRATETHGRQTVAAPAADAGSRR